MGDKKTYIFPSLLFIVFFLLIAVTGYFQIRLIRSNVEDWLRSEGELIFSHIKREIDINLEYLRLNGIENIPSIITPNLMNVMVYDEDIVEDLYALLNSASEDDFGKLPFSNTLIIDMKGNVVLKRGTIAIPQSYIAPILSGNQQTLIKMPAGKGKSLLMGIRVRNYVIFFILDDNELEKLRTKHVIREILEREGKRLNVVGIGIYDGRGLPYVSSNGHEQAGYTVTRPLNVPSLPDFTIKILLSQSIAQKILERITTNFIIILSLLIISGALGTYFIFYLERRHSRRMGEMEREMS
ncbi:MAG: hypothetical protein EHM12_10465, partial [Dehalococcoidia bacterium]